MSLLDPSPTPPQYWRSLDELSRIPRSAGPDHPARHDPSSTPSEMTSDFSRRTFLQLMAASAALSGSLTGCRRPEYKILPYSTAPEDLLPGVPQHYATCMERGGVPIGLIVTSHEGRPTKIEGNPDHPAGFGAVDAMTQAAILELYDPDRSQSVLRGSQPSSLQDFAQFATDHFKRLQTRQGEGLYFLSEPSCSPTLKSMVGSLQSVFPQAVFYTWAPLNEDNIVQGMQIAADEPRGPRYDFARADVIVSLDADFLNGGPHRLTAAKAFAKRRSPGTAPDLSNPLPMNRLYVAESAFSLTGAKADHRLPLRSCQIPTFALELTSALDDELQKGNNQVLAPLRPILAQSHQHFAHEPWVRAMALDLVRHLGRGLIVVGDRQPAPIHALACLLNQMLGPDCVDYRPHGSNDQANVRAQIALLADAIKRGRVDTLVMLGGNPAYDAPADLDFAKALAKVKTSIHLGLYANETSRLCSWHIPRAHALESWADTQTDSGQESVTQPLIAPLYGGLTDIELLARIGNQPTRQAYEIVKSYYRQFWPAAAVEEKWKTILNAGLNAKPDTPAPPLPPLRIEAIIKSLQELNPAHQGEDDLELVFLPHPYLYDGRYANNGWLQETPEPITKLCWGNAALISPATAQRQGLKNEDLVRLELAGRSAELPVWIVPGMAPGSVAVHLGYGRTSAGRVGNGVGQNVYPLRTLTTMDCCVGLKITPLGRKFPLVTMRAHPSMEGRDLVREVSGAQPDLAHGHAVEATASPLFQSPNPTDGPQWGMVIDLSACIGCHACVVACQAENNTAIVGKTQVGNGREMQWLRVDRYFKGSPDNPQVVFQPLPCMHCETAPCEQVCPVTATTHSPEGVNEMAYNRCVGTRYCSNNCPYKVRHFNFFAYTNKKTDVEKMGMNPDVTVRMRGVMEKCTYCVQRINRARIQSKNEDRPIRDGEVTPACAQACPAKAIHFGNINDPKSEVARFKHHPRNYGLLAEINTRPRTTYLALVRNPNPEMKG